MPIFKTPNQSFRWLFAELTVVVIGILIAFQIEEWRNGLADLDSEQTALSGILNDLSAEQTVLNQLAESARRQYAGVAALEHEILKDAGYDAEAIGQAYRDATFGRGFNPASPTYSGLKDSGQLHLITDSKLGSDLYNYYEDSQRFLEDQVEGMIDQRILLRDSFSTDLYRTINGDSTENVTVVETTNFIGEKTLFAVVLPLSDMPRNPIARHRLGELAGRVSLVENRTSEILQENIELTEKIESYLQ
ncbi:MAG: DUF6090 family protein [Coleofasciculus sp. C2-GNP5-27]